LKILHIIPYYLPAIYYGGPVYSVHNLCKRLVRRGHQVSVFTTNRHGAEELDVPTDQFVEKDGVRINYFKTKLMKRLYFSPDMNKALTREVRNFDIVHLHGLYAWPTFAGAKAAKRRGVPYVLAPRGMLVKNLISKKSRWAKTAYIHLIEKRNIEGAAAIHLTSAIEQKEARRFNFKFPHEIIIPNSIWIEDDAAEDRQLLKTPAAILNKKPFFLFLGRICWSKRLEIIITAMRYAGDANLVIAGAGDKDYCEKLKLLVDECKLQDRIFFLGWADGSDKAALLREASALVLSSYSENFSNAVLEAMFAGCPVVVVPQVGLAEIIEQTGSGSVVDSDPKVFGLSLKGLLADPEKCQRMGEAGKKAVAQYFMPEHIAAQMEEVYINLMRKHSQ